MVAVVAILPYPIHTLSLFQGRSCWGSKSSCFARLGPQCNTEALTSQTNWDSVWRHIGATSWTVGLAASSSNLTHQKGFLAISPASCKVCTKNSGLAKWLSGHDKDSKERAMVEWTGQIWLTRHWEIPQLIDFIWFDLIWFDLIDWLIDWLMHCNLPVQAPSGQDFLPHALPRILEPNRANMFVLRYLIYLHYLALLWRFLRGPIFRCSCIPFFAGPSRRCEEYGGRFRASASAPRVVTAATCIQMHSAPLRQRVEKCGRKSETTLYGCQDNAIVETPIQDLQGWSISPFCIVLRSSRQGLFQDMGERMVALINAVPLPKTGPGTIWSNLINMSLQNFHKPFHLVYQWPWRLHYVPDMFVGRCDEPSRG